MAMDNLTSVSVVLDLTVADENVFVLSFLFCGQFNFYFIIKLQHPAKLMISIFFVTQF